MYTLVIACYFLSLLVCFVVLGVSPVLAAAGAYVSVLAIAVKYWVNRWKEGTGLSAVEIETGLEMVVYTMPVTVAAVGGLVIYSPPSFNLAGFIILHLGAGLWSYLALLRQMAK